MGEKPRDDYRPPEEEIRQMLREEELEREKYFWEHWNDGMEEEE